MMGVVVVMVVVLMMMMMVMQRLHVTRDDELLHVDGFTEALDHISVESSRKGGVWEAF